MPGAGPLGSSLSISRRRESADPRSNVGWELESVFPLGADSIASLGAKERRGAEKHPPQSASILSAHREEAQPVKARPRGPAVGRERHGRTCEKVRGRNALAASGDDTHRTLGQGHLLQPGLCTQPPSVTTHQPTRPAGTQARPPYRTLRGGCDAGWPYCYRDYRQCDILAGLFRVGCPPG